MILYLACETTGAWQWRLPDDDALQPHVVRVAAILEAPDGTVRTERCRLIQPGHDWVFEEGAIRAHGIDAETALHAGFPSAQVAAEFGEMLTMAPRMVAFGADFQARVVRRLFADMPSVAIPAELVCCMKASRDLVRKPQPNGNGRAIPSFAEAFWAAAGHAVPTADDPVEAGILKVRAVRTIHQAITNGARP